VDVQLGSWTQPYFSRRATAASVELQPGASAVIHPWRLVSVTRHCPSEAGQQVGGLGDGDASFVCPEAPMRATTRRARRVEGASIVEEGVGEKKFLIFFLLLALVLLLQRIVLFLCLVVVLLLVYLLLPQPKQLE